MSAALLLITHNKVAASLMEITASIIHTTPVNCACVEVPMDAEVDIMQLKIEGAINQLDTSDGILILTDMYGGTPSNIAKQFAAGNNTRLVSGLNLPMLVRIMNYRDLPLTELTEKAVSGGQQGIRLYEDKPD